MSKIRQIEITIIILNSWKGSWGNFEYLCPITSVLARATESTNLDNRPDRPRIPITKIAYKEPRTTGMPKAGAPWDWSAVLPFPRPVSAASFFSLTSGSSDHIISHSHLVLDVNSLGNFIKLVWFPVIGSKYSRVRCRRVIGSDLCVRTFLFTAKGCSILRSSSRLRRAKRKFAAHASESGLKGAMIDQVAQCG